MRGLRSTARCAPGSFGPTATRRRAPRSPVGANEPSTERAARVIRSVTGHGVEHDRSSSAHQICTAGRHQRTDPPYIPPGPVSQSPAPAGKASRTPHRRSRAGSESADSPHTRQAMLYDAIAITVLRQRGFLRGGLSRCWSSRTAAEVLRMSPLYE